MDLFGTLFTFTVAGYTHTGLLAIFTGALLLSQIWFSANKLEQNFFLWLFTGLWAYGVGAHLGHRFAFWFLVDALDFPAHHNLVGLAWELGILLPLELNLPGYAAVFVGFSSYLLATFLLSLVLQWLADRYRDPAPGKGTRRNSSLAPTVYLKDR